MKAQSCISSYRFLIKRYTLFMERLLGIIVCFFVAVLTLVPFFVLAAEQQSVELSISPVVIDEKAQARDIIKKSITLVNTSDRKLQIYPSVNNVDAEDGKQDFVSAIDSSDRAASLANWIELSRGVAELGPGEEKIIPFVIRVNMNAIPGEYHAKIAFGDGSSRSAAEGHTLASIMVNLEIRADVKEIMQLKKFSTENFFFSGDDVLFNYQLENIGNQELQPRGEVRIYNRRGEEVASVGVNEEGKSFAPSQLAQLASVWSASEGFGRYKAFLSVDYGQGQGASVQDTVYFWVIPWKQLLALFIVSLIAIIFFALYFHKWFEERHLVKLAGAGVLNAHPADVAAAVSTRSRMSIGGVIGIVVSPFAILTKIIPRIIPRISFDRDANKDRSGVSEYAEAQQISNVTERQSKVSLRDAFEQVNPERMSSPQRSAPSFVDTQWGTIDLKKRKKARADEEPSHGNVINLKRR